ncbi:MAG: sulfatase-like hydrolase/transferase [Acidobacteriota bacterium]
MRPTCFTALRRGALVGLLQVAVSGAVFAEPTESATENPQATAAANAAGAESGPTPPNIIFLLVDDAREIEIDIGFGRSLEGWTSALETELFDRGVVFENFFNSTPLCCPSRVNYFTGQYSHNNGVYANNYLIAGGNAGWRRFWELGHEQESIGSWLQKAGYHTVLIGKSLNGYPNKPGNFLPENYVLGGWDEWYGSYTNDDPFSYYQFRINENGTIVDYGSEEAPAYLTDIERDLALAYIDRQAGTGTPFFMYLSVFSPHGPIQEAPRHSGAHAAVTVPDPPAFAEQDLSDKPLYVQESAAPFFAFWNAGWNRKLDMTLAIDELIAALFDKLEEHSLLDNTYVFFASDNGLIFGEHSVSGKTAPYEEAIRSPLIVRGPGVPEGQFRDHLAINIDLAPTFLDLAEAPIPAVVDGESLAPLFPEDFAGEWREGILIEYRQTLDSSDHELSGGRDINIEPGDVTRAFTSPVPAYFGYRTRGHMYIEYETGEKELYDMVVDAAQMESQHLSAPAELVNALQTPLEALSTCAGTECHAAARLEAPNALPLAAFSIDCSGDELVCTFDASDSLDVDGTIATYQWSFEDGVEETLDIPTIVHRFPRARRWRVTLTVTDNEGGQRSHSISLLIGGPEIFSDGFESGDVTQWPGIVIG